MNLRTLIPGRAPWAAIMTAAGLSAALAGCGSGGTAAAGGPATSALPGAATVSTTSATGTALRISVQSGSAMRAAWNPGPASSILHPSSCRVSGKKVTARGTYHGSFVPTVYGRYGDVIDLYVFTAPSSGYPGGTQLAELGLAHHPVLGGARTWTATVTLDTALGKARRCLIAAQPTHDFEGAGAAY